MVARCSLDFSRIADLVKARSDQEALDAIEAAQDLPELDSHQSGKLLLLQAKVLHRVGDKRSLDLLKKGLSLPIADEKLYRGFLLELATQQMELGDKSQAYKTAYEGIKSSKPLPFYFILARTAQTLQSTNDWYVKLIKQLPQESISRAKAIGRYAEFLNKHGKHNVALDYCLSVFEFSHKDRDCFGKILLEIGKANFGLRDFSKASSNAKNGRTLGLTDSELLRDLFILEAEAHHQLSSPTNTLTTLIEGVNSKLLYPEEKIPLVSMLLNSWRGVRKKTVPEARCIHYELVALIQQTLSKKGEGLDSIGETFYEIANELAKQDQAHLAMIFTQQGRSLPLKDTQMKRFLFELEVEVLIGQKAYKKAFALASEAVSSLKDSGEPLDELESFKYEAIKRLGVFDDSPVRFHRAPLSDITKVQQSAGAPKKVVIGVKRKATDILGSSKESAVMLHLPPKAQEG